MSSRFWKLSLAFALLFVVADSVARLRGVAVLNDANSGGTRVIASDSTTPSGYAGNQHVAVLPILGTDGYHWAMQTQQMLATGDARIRHVDYDGPPEGRDVHWSSILRWITAGAVAVVAAVTDRSSAQAVETVAPWINTLVFCVLLLVLVPVVSKRFGSGPAGVLAIGMVAVYPAYELYAIGNFDHHGIASSAALLSVLCLLGGGAGWVRGDSGGARAWFVASGVAGGAGLWISAATQLPVLIAIGVAVLVSHATLTARDHADNEWRMDPALWRVWGIAGAITSVAFYLAEYAPSHMTLRLEVNHPLYALAWFGAGEVLALTPAVFRERRALDIARLVVSAALVVLLPVVALFDAQSFVLRPGSMIMALHEDYIDEFRSLPRQVVSWSAAQVVAGVGFLPLLAGFPALAVSFSKRVPAQLRALALISVAPPLLFTTLAFRHGRWLNTALVLWLATAVAIAMIIAALPWQSLRRPSARRWMAVGAFVAFAPFPLFSVYQWFTSVWTVAPTSSALTQIVARDLSYKLRARLGDERGVIASSPTATTWMTYFGGFRGVGTLYWENRDGIAANARLFGAPAGDTNSRGAGDALAIARQLGVTHIVIYSWAPFMTEYARLSRGIRGPASASIPADSLINDAFGPRLMQGAVPIWLTPLPFRPPEIPGITDASVLVLEVSPAQTATEAGVRFAKYSLAMNDVATAVRLLNGALADDPANASALITLARLQQADTTLGSYRATLRRAEARSAALDSLALEDDVALASVYAIANDTTRARAVLTRALRRADARAIRRLPWDYTAANMIVLARQLGVRDRPELLELAYQLLDPAVQAQLR
ncbi:MAG TPA: hypothetical protein VJR92_05805 [Gemmatimonadaceae bacterium]|nr:hypothetical protein [Gemmatimonadaceae bacterium]